MDLHEYILKQLKTRGKLKTSDIVKKTNYSRSHVHQILQTLRDEGKIALIGKANKAYYIFADPALVAEEKNSITHYHRYIKTQNLQEHQVLSDIKKSTGIFQQASRACIEIIDYAFLEMLNNAIEHAQSEKIDIVMEVVNSNIHFSIRDFGIGIYHHIATRKQLADEDRAIEELLKGKLTTAPQAHSGEGIFFTARCADTFFIASHEKKLVFSNLQEDVFVRSIKKRNGTYVSFSLALNTQRTLSKIFNKYAGGEYQFDKTEVHVFLYKLNTQFVSRSQARRLITGLEKFSTIILDFAKVAIIGQGFADEIFRVYENKYPSKEILIKNANDDVLFMINHVKNSSVIPYKTDKTV